MNESHEIIEMALLIYLFLIEFDTLPTGAEAYKYHIQSAERNGTLTLT